MWHRVPPLLMGAILLSGCAGAVHQLPLVDQSNLSLAQSEVEKAGGPPQRHAASDEETRSSINAAVDRIITLVDGLEQLGNVRELLDAVRAG